MSLKNYNHYASMVVADLTAMATLIGGAAATVVGFGDKWQGIALIVAGALGKAAIGVKATESAVSFNRLRDGGATAQGVPPAAPAVEPLPADDDVASELDLSA